MTSSSFRWFHWLSVLLLCSTVLLAGVFSFPVTDEDEARYAQATKQMLETQQFFVINIQDKARHLKPPGIYWLQAGATKLTQSPPYEATFSYRLPAFIAACILAFLLLIAGRWITGDATAGWFSSLMFTSFLLVGYESSFVSPDMVFTLCVFVMMLAGWGCYQRSRNQQPVSWQWPLVFWLAMSMGILIKGLSPLFAFMPILALSVIDRSLSWLKSLRPFIGLLFVILFTAAWLFLVSLKGHSNFLWDMIHNDLLPKLEGGQQHHGAPPSYFILLLPALTWPMSLYLVPTVRGSIRYFNKSPVRYCVASILSVWIVFALAPTKLPQYILPLFPLLAILMGYALMQVRAGDKPSHVGWRSAQAILWFLYNIVIIVGSLYVAFFYRIGFSQPILLTIAAVVFVNMWLAYWLYCRDKIIGSIVSNSVTSMIVVVLILQYLLPSNLNLWTSRQIGQYTKQHAVALALDQSPMLVVGDSATSMIFEIGTWKIKQVTVGGLPSELKSSDHRWVLLNERNKPAFDRLVRLHDWSIKSIKRFTGFSLNHGKVLNLTLYRVQS